MPVALLGLLGYAAILVAALLPGEASRLVTAWLAAVGFGFSLYLTYLELFEIHAICQWCVASAVIMAILAVLAVMRALQRDFGPPAAARADRFGSRTTGT